MKYYCKDCNTTLIHIDDRELLCPLCHSEVEKTHILAYEGVIERYYCPECKKHFKLPQLHILEYDRFDCPYCGFFVKLLKNPVPLKAKTEG